MVVYIGIDWSEKFHEVAVMNQQGGILLRESIPHSDSGFAEFVQRLHGQGIRAEEAIVGLETAHNPLIDFLWSQGFAEVYVIPPAQVSHTRGRYRQSGAKSDAFDAAVLADLLRSDRHRWQPWRPDSVLTQQIRAEVSQYQYLSKAARQVENRLRSILLYYYPAATEVFGSLDSRVALEFIRTYPTPEAAKALSYEDFLSFTRSQSYTHPSELAARYARLQAAYVPAAAARVAAWEGEAVVLALLLSTVLDERKAVLRRMQEHFQAHPDAAIFASMPGAGEFLAPALLSKFGDDRQRFPQAWMVQALAGTCPVTIRSGKYKRVRFRQACDKDFRQIAQQWARCSVKQSPWANTYLEQLRARGHEGNHAYRCLANRWLAILWACWQKGTPYDEAYHMQQRMRRCQPR